MTYEKKSNDGVAINTMVGYPVTATSASPTQNLETLLQITDSSSMSGSLHMIIEMWNW